VTQFSILGAIARLGDANLRQLAHTLAIDQTTLTRSLKLLERNGAIDRVPHPDGRIKAMTLTSKGRQALEAARPLWARAQDRVLRDWARRVGGRAAAAGPLAWGRRQKRSRIRSQSRVRQGAHEEKPLMSIERRMRGRVHYGDRRGGTFVTLLAAAGIRSAPVGTLRGPATNKP